MSPLRENGKSPGTSQAIPYPQENWYTGKALGIPGSILDHTLPYLPSDRTPPT